MSGPAGAVRSPFRVTSAARTHAGRRAVNEDAYLVRDALSFWAVADGMGGHEGGAHASQVVVQQLGGMRLRSEAHGMLLQLRDRVHAAHDQLRDETRARGGGTIGSTVVAFMHVGVHAIFAWAGDSRGYLLSQGELRRATRDHSLVQEMVDRGELTEAEAERHPGGHVLTRAVGASEPFDLDYRQVTLARGDRCLLCSDGLTGVLPEAEIRRVIHEYYHPAAICDELVRLVLNDGAPDNVTAAVIAFD